MILKSKRIDCKNDWLTNYKYMPQRLSGTTVHRVDSHFVS
jgi:hypothetical protein